MIITICLVFFISHYHEASSNFVTFRGFSSAEGGISHLITEVNNIARSRLECIALELLHNPSLRLVEYTTAEGCRSGTYFNYSELSLDPSGSQLIYFKRPTISVDATWSEWSPWSPCPSTCQSDDGCPQTRTRDCIPHQWHGSPGCEGADTESNPCPINGMWSDWEAWSKCSLTCSGGAQTRARACDNPAPALGGLDCPAEANEMRSCNTVGCVGYLSEIQTATGTVTDAGMDSGGAIMFQFCNASSCCRTPELDNPDCDDFQPGQKDVFEAELIGDCASFDLSTVNRGTLHHLRTDGWYMDRIGITSSLGNRLSCYPTTKNKGSWGFFVDNEDQVEITCEL